MNKVIRVQYITKNQSLVVKNIKCTYQLYEPAQSFKKLTNSRVVS